ncbi:hypothetical protein YYC_01114 [Plasmodium yoelii 17X]|uniref:Uncharacterized protein n=1 Tax=Plasmodium yoelii 17X TaxID=1323249 RepID=V7PSK7_PLAYE|nr:hypothetical protein YYC_01114 [Plasmodium yoelii 17X]
MRVSIKILCFSISICFFEYAPNTLKLKKQLKLYQELYYVNERSIYFERDIVKFRSNRILKMRQPIRFI